MFEHLDSLTEVRWAHASLRNRGRHKATAERRMARTQEYTVASPTPVCTAAEADAQRRM